eukprot:UN11804
MNFEGRKILAQIQIGKFLEDFNNVRLFAPYS